MYHDLFNEFILFNELMNLYYLMNMHVDPYKLICRIDTHTNCSCARNQI